MEINSNSRLINLFVLKFRELQTHGKTPEALKSLYTPHIAEERKIKM